MSPRRLLLPVIALLLVACQPALSPSPSVALRHVRHIDIDAGAELRRPVLELVQLGDLLIRVEQEAQRGHKRGAAAEENHMASHRLMPPTLRQQWRCP